MIKISKNKILWSLVVASLAIGGASLGVGIYSITKDDEPTNNIYYMAGKRDLAHTIGCHVSDVTYVCELSKGETYGVWKLHYFGYRNAIHYDLPINEYCLMVNWQYGSKALVVNSWNLTNMTNMK